MLKKGRYKMAITDFAKAFKENIVAKLFNDKITLSKFNKPRVDFDWLTVDTKIHRVTGEVTPWNWTDAFRRARSFRSSVSRTLRTLGELSNKNKFSWFLTVSFNQNYVDRYSALAVHKKFKNIMKRLKYHMGGVSYLCVGEFHKDRAIHYHVMINFVREPKTHYHFATNCRDSYWTFSKNEKFKRDDCMLILKRLQTNNLHYLTKYITKSAEYPLSRKFSATRDLNRSRLVDKIMFTHGFDKLVESAKANGFFNVFTVGKTATWEYGGTHGERACAAVDLFKLDIKDENITDFYYRFITEYQIERERVVKRAYLKRENTQNATKQAIEQKLPYGQLTFKLGVFTSMPKTIRDRKYYW